MKDLLLAVLEFGPVFDVLVTIAESPIGVFGALAVATLTAIGVGIAANRAGLRGPLPEIAAVASAAALLLIAAVLFVEPVDRGSVAAGERPDAEVSSDSTDRLQQADR